jgi:hypothetical protein
VSRADLLHAIERHAARFALEDIDDAEALCGAHRSINYTLFMHGVAVTNPCSVSSEHLSSRAALL